MSYELIPTRTVKLPDFEPDLHPTDLPILEKLLGDDTGCIISSKGVARWLDDLISPDTIYPADNQFVTPDTFVRISKRLSVLLPNIKSEYEEELKQYIEIFAVLGARGIGGFASY